MIQGNPLIFLPAVVQIHYLPQIVQIYHCYQFCGSRELFQCYEVSMQLPVVGDSIYHKQVSVSGYSRSFRLHFATLHNRSARRIFYMCLPMMALWRSETNEVQTSLPWRKLGEGWKVRGRRGKWREMISYL